eukprot:Polyplicarium_translucidae@DN1619_c0_g1_i1.p1
MMRYHHSSRRTPGKGRPIAAFAARGCVPVPRPTRPQATPPEAEAGDTFARPRNLPPAVHVAGRSGDRLRCGLSAVARRGRGQLPPEWGQKPPKIPKSPPLVPGEPRLGRARAEDVLKWFSWERPGPLLHFGHLASAC